MTRTLLFALVVLTTDSAVAVAQTRDTPGHHGTDILFEAAIGARLNRQPNPGAQDAAWYVSWELGPSFNQGDWAWGATIMAAADEDGSRWGIRPRYRRWLGPKTALNFGAGILLGGESNNARQHYPAFAGLIGLSYGSWLGVNLELHAIRNTHYSPEYYDPMQGGRVPGTETESTDLAVMLGARVSGVGAIALSAAEAVLLVIAAASYSGSW
jgi:hypothetical protein